MNETPSELVICVETCFKEIILDSTVYSTSGLLHILLTICRRLEYLGSQTCTLISPQEFRLRREPRVILFFCSQVFRVAGL